MVDPPTKTLPQKFGGLQESWGVRTPPVVAPLVVTTVGHSGQLHAP